MTACTNYQADADHQWEDAHGHPYCNCGAPACEHDGVTIEPASAYPIGSENAERASNGWMKIVNVDAGPIGTNHWTIHRRLLLVPEMWEGGGTTINLAVSLHKEAPEIPPTLGYLSCGLNLTRAQAVELRAALADFLEPPDMITDLRDIAEDTKEL